MKKKLLQTNHSSHLITGLTARMQRVVLPCFYLAGVLSLGVSCSQSHGIPGFGHGDMAREHGGFSGEGMARADGSGATSANGQASLEAGQLTAGAWDDNLHYDAYLNYLESAGEVPYEMLPSAERVVIEVRDSAGAPVLGAQVTVLDDDNNPLITLTTVSDGRVLFFPGYDALHSQYKVQVEKGDASTNATVNADSPHWDITLVDHDGNAPQTLDLAFVIDTTGSMGDELRYLKTELDWVIREVQSQHPALDIRLAITAYKDRGDEYLTRKFNFSSDTGSVLDDLASLSASGGGDYPEAMAEALQDTVELGWSDNDAVKVAFVLADAPPQVRQETSAKAALSAREQGIRFYPVGASGVGDEAELVMRQLAQFTLGQYLFLTDDSGIGNSHAEPNIRCYHVELLNELMVRVIDNNINGNWEAPQVDDIIRSVGMDEDGECISVATQDYKEAL